VIQLILLSVALLLAAFCSGTETAFITASRIRAYSRLREGRKHAKLTLGFIEHPRKFLTTALVGTNIGVVLASGVTARFALGTGIPWLEPVLVTLLSFFILVFTEMLPKYLLLLARERMVHRLAVPLFVLRILLYPIIILSQLLSTLITGRRKDPRLFENKAEILGLLSGSSGEAGRLAGRALSLDSQSAADIMRDLSDVTHIRTGASKMRVLLRSLDSDLPFLLVRERAGNGVRGYVDTSTIAGSEGDLEGESIKGFPYFDESSDLMSIISGLSAVSSPAGIVIGADGQPSGIVLLDDIVDLLLGKGGSPDHERTAELPMLTWDGDRAEVV